MPLTPTHPEEDDLDALAARFWQHHDRFVGGAGAGTADPSDDAIAGAEDRVTEVFDRPADRDDMALALVFARRNNEEDLAALADGIFGDAVRGGDEDLLLRLRHRGVPAAVVAAIAQSILS